MSESTRGQPIIPPHLLSSIPTSAIPIPPPDPTSSKPPQNVIKSNIPTFPPNSASGPSTNPPKKSGTISMSSLPTNVSDLLLSSLLPPNLPKLPPSTSAGGSTKKGIGLGVPRELSTQRESLSLPLVSNNFRRFMTRVGPIFWLQDRIEEILFWRKPIWTWAWMMTWSFICFKPRVLLLLPSLILILILLHTHEKTSPLPSLLGISMPPSNLTDRKTVPGSPDLSKANSGNPTSGGYSTTTTKDSEGETVEKPTVAPKESESGVDIYMNLQAIQNLMGLVSDGYDYLAPRLTSFFAPGSNQSTINSSSNLPITFTHIILICLPASFLLPLTPAFLIPYLLLPIGFLPPLIFHPNLTSYLLALPSHPIVKRIRSYLEVILLDDKLSDEIGNNKKIDKVEVWENQRLDPKFSSGGSSTTVAGSGKTVDITAGSWGGKFLRASDRSPWVKVDTPNTKWKSTTGEQSTLPSGSGSGESTDKEKEKEAKMILALKDGWDWIPNEDWRVDVCGLWSENGVDDEGWSYTDDSWQNPAPTPYTEAEIPTNDKNASGGQVQMPGLALRRTTRRRKWWRRVYEV
ncbi:hypothetical protein V865_005908 [Kwoniella europaea PYCC6329]|uniref:TECPR1-like DysF domain-containing protein n=1 Tax=Kwoniella europaea PYCC6329 TaxID=1423913 RepID=A0AAX4KNT7_9TREE